MGKQLPGDQRQADLFGAPAPPEEKQPRPRRRRAAEVAEAEASEAPAEPQPPAPMPAPLPPPEPESLATLAGRAGRAELDELVAVLNDEGLAHLALASARAVKRRVARSKGRGANGGGKGRAGPLERVAQTLASEFAGPPSDDAW